MWYKSGTNPEIGYSSTDMNSMQEVSSVEKQKKLLEEVFTRLKETGHLTEEEVSKHMAYVMQDVVVNAHRMNKRPRQYPLEGYRGKNAYPRIVKRNVTVILDPAYIIFNDMIYVKRVTWIVFVNGTLLEGIKTRNIAMPNRKMCNGQLLKLYDEKLKKDYGEWTHTPSTRYFKFYNDIISRELLNNYPDAKWICKDVNVCRRLLTCKNVYLGRDNLQTGKMEPFHVNKKGFFVKIEKTPLEDFIPSDSPLKPCWQMADTYKRVEESSSLYVIKKQQPV